jgi:hypothetical protein
VRDPPESALDGVVLPSLQTRIDILARTASFTLALLELLNLL